MAIPTRSTGLIQRYREDLQARHAARWRWMSNGYGGLDQEGVVRAWARRRLPVVLSEEEVGAVRRELE